METPKFKNSQEQAMFDLMAESFMLFCQKNADYGTGNISTLGIKGVFVRMNDKMARLKRLVWDDNPPEVKSETVEDTLIDLANYALIACLIQRGEWS